jgi:hypothetical protein
LKVWCLRSDNTLTPGTVCYTIYNASQGQFAGLQQQDLAAACNVDGTGWADPVDAVVASDRHGIATGGAECVFMFAFGDCGSSTGMAPGVVAVVDQSDYETYEAGYPQTWMKGGCF